VEDGLLRSEVGFTFCGVRAGAVITISQQHAMLTWTSIIRELPQSWERRDGESLFFCGVRVTGEFVWLG
jgi:hypothetical protein